MCTPYAFNLLHRWHNILLHGKLKSYAHNFKTCRSLDSFHSISQSLDFLCIPQALICQIVYRNAHSVFLKCINYSTNHSLVYVGKVGITLNSDWKEPKTDSPQDKAAALRALYFLIGWFANPIFRDGNYPQVMIDQVAKISKLQGLNVSRLPEFTAAEIAYNKGKHKMSHNASIHRA